MTCSRQHSIPDQALAMMFRTDVAHFSSNIVPLHLQRLAFTYW